MKTLSHPDQFSRRHIGPNATETAEMLKFLGHASLEALTDAAVPKKVHLTAPVSSTSPEASDFPAPKSENSLLPAGRN